MEAAPRCAASLTASMMGFAGSALEDMKSSFWYIQSLPPFDALFSQL
jgi:hypothetical protein